MSKFAWTNEQAAALTASTDVLLTANAGTGKTLTIVGKIMWMLGLKTGHSEDQKNIPINTNPCKINEIAAITFNRKNAADLRQKLRHELLKSEDPNAKVLALRLEEAFIGTIHSFCESTLREHALRLGVDPAFKVLNAQLADLKKDEIVKEVILDKLDEDQPEIKALVQRFGLNNVISQTRTMLTEVRWHPERYEEWNLVLTDQQQITECQDPKDRLTRDLTYGLYSLAHSANEKWQRQLLINNERDFDQLILEIRSLLCSQQASSALQQISSRYKILIIDEFQDTDHAQRDIAFSIGRAGRTKLFLVGDPKQSIYGWRGADITVWNEVKDRIETSGHVLSLTKNFRTDPEVIDAINTVCGPAIDDSAAKLREVGLDTSAIDYQEMEASRSPSGTAQCGLINLEASNSGGRRLEEGMKVGTHIQQLVGQTEIIDPKTNDKRPCTYQDIAILYRNRTDLDLFQRGLTEAGVPFQTSNQDWSQSTENTDIVNLLRLLNNPDDNYHALGYLSSPFVAIRDEVITRIRMSNFNESLLGQARTFLDKHTWPDYPDNPAIPELEKDALERGLKTLDKAHKLAGRMPLPDLLRQFLSESAYSVHLFLGDKKQAEEAHSNIQDFLQFTEDHRQASIEEFLELWELSLNEKPTRVSTADAEADLVTVSTIHKAKGLEWPIVFTIQNDKSVRQRSNELIPSDRAFSSSLYLKKSDNGPHNSERLAPLNMARLEAEECRLLYVSMTRARDRLIVCGQADKKTSGFFWERFNQTHSWDEISIQPHLQQITDHHWVPLDWIDDIEAKELPPLAAEIKPPSLQFTTSATEVMTKQRSFEEWREKYEYGVQSIPAFSGHSSGRIPSQTRGKVIHGVLERIQEYEELPEILNETLSSMDTAELGTSPSLGSKYWEALEHELEEVLKSPDWKWYIEGEHYRELPFIHLVGPRNWYLGAFDLYRPSTNIDKALVVDFKTHELEKSDIEEVAKTYLPQMQIYQEAAEISQKSLVQLHFTVPNSTWPSKTSASEENTLKT